jgi:hypothetical protein
MGPFGVAYDPLSGRWRRSTDVDVNYMMTVLRPPEGPIRARKATGGEKASAKPKRRRTKA